MEVGATAGCTGTARTGWSRRRTRPRRATGGRPGTRLRRPRRRPAAARARRRARRTGAPTLHSAYLARMSRPLRSTSASVSWNWTPWKVDSGWPNCLRSRTWSWSARWHGRAFRAASSTAAPARARRRRRRRSSTADSSRAAEKAGPAVDSRNTELRCPSNVTAAQRLSRPTEGGLGRAVGDHDQAVDVEVGGAGKPLGDRIRQCPVPGAAAQRGGGLQ